LPVGSELRHDDMRERKLIKKILNIVFAIKFYHNHRTYYIVKQFEENKN
jgi:hypothetical protein